MSLRITRREVVFAALFLTVLTLLANTTGVAQTTYPISVHMGIQNWSSEMREIGETTQERGLIVWISVNNTHESLPARITSGKLVLDLSPHSPPQSINLEFRDVLVPAQKAVVWYFSIMPAITLYGYGEAIPKPEPGEYVLKVSYELDIVQWFDTDGITQVQSIPTGATLDPLIFRVVSTEQRLQDDIKQHQGIVPSTAYSSLSNQILSGIIVAVVGGVASGAFLYFLFYRRKRASEKASVVGIGEVQRGGTVIQNIYSGGGSDPESSKRILENIPDQLFVREPRVHVKPVQAEPTNDPSGLIHKVAQNTLGNGPLTPIVADSLEIARILKMDEESRWLQRELYGYETKPSDQPNTFPEYRTISARIPIRLSAVTNSGEVSEDINVERTLFVSFPVKRIEDTVSGARSRDALELVFWMNTPKEFSEMAKEQNAQITSENAGKTPFIVQINDLERLLSELRLRIHRFVTSL